MTGFRPVVRRPDISGGVLVAVLAYSALACGVTALMTFAAPASQGRLIFLAIGAVFTAWLFVTRSVLLALGLLVLYLGLLDGFLKLKFGGSVIIVGRDVILFSICAGLLARRASSPAPLNLPKYSSWVVAFTVVVVAQLFNPDALPLGKGVQALRPLLEFVPLFFIGAELIQGARILERLMLLLVIVAGINGAVGLVQSRLTPDQLASWGPGYSNLVKGKAGFVGASRTFTDSTGKEQVRPMALGSDLGYGGAVGYIALPPALALMASVRRRKAQLIAILGLIGVATAILTSQARVTVIGAAVALLIYLLLTAATRQRAAATLGIAVGLGIAALTINGLTGSSNSVLTERYETIAPSRLLDSAVADRGGPWKAFPNLIKTMPFGGGLGLAGPAAGLRKDVENRPNAENAFNYFQIETGLPGLLLFIAMCGVVYAAGLRKLRKLPDRDESRYLAALAASLGALFVVSTAAATFGGNPGSPFLWLALGVFAGVARRPVRNLKPEQNVNQASALRAAPAPGP